MRKVIKTKGKILKAYELGAASQTERDMIAAGRIRVLDGGKYEVFSREAVNGSGEIVSAGDFFKVDSGGYPYPNPRAFFMANHKPLGDELYEQIPRPLDAWTADEEMCEEIEFLIAVKGLRIDEDNAGKYYTAPLYGTLESAARDAVIVFYAIERDENGRMTDADFNFVERGEFDLTYEWTEAE